MTKQRCWCGIKLINFLQLCRVLESLDGSTNTIDRIDSVWAYRLLQLNKYISVMVLFVQYHFTKILLEVVCEIKDELIS